MLIREFETKPINKKHDNYIIVEITYQSEATSEIQYLSLEMIMFRQYAYNAQKGQNQKKANASKLLANYSLKLFNKNTGKISDKSISVTKDGKLYVEVTEEKNKIKLLLEDFVGGVSEDFFVQNPDGELNRKIVLDTLNYSGIIQEKAEKIAIKKYQNPSMIVTDLSFDTEKEIVLVTVSYRHGKSKCKQESFPFSLLYE